MTRKARTTRRPGAPAVALALATALLAGCGGDGGDGATPGRTGGSSPTATDPTATGGATGSDAPPPRGDAEVVQTVATGLSAPWGVVVLPDGDLLVGLRDEATIQHVAREGGEVTRVGSVPGVAADGEGGLLGLALDPDFSATDGGALYAYHTTASDNRVSRLTYRPGGPDGAGRLGTPETVLDGIPRGETIHNGGGLTFGPDGMLYVSTGDTGRPDLAQDVDSLAGKILRVDPDTGRPPPDNPTAGSPVYSLGHRNVQGLAFDADGRLWASEFGEHTWDELNLVEPGGNHGWPEHEGAGGADDGFVDPVAQWSPAEASPSGLAYCRGSLWLAALRGERLWRVPLDGAKPAAEPQAFLVGEFGRLRTVVPAGEDELLVVTNETDTRGTPAAGDDRVLRVRVR